jgi:predicted ABC-type ATPase
VDTLRAGGWRVELIYLALPNKAMSHQRVAERVAHGGHDIPAADIERRFARSLRHLLHDFSHRVDRCQCFLNSGVSMELVFDQAGAGRVVHHAAHYQQLVQESYQ